MNRDKDTIKKMIEYCQDIELLMTKYDESYELYQTDISFQYSCNMCIIQIGELITRISDEFKKKNPQIPWKIIKNMRNIHAHDYEHVDMDIMWETLTIRIPELKEQLIQLI